MGDWGDEVLRRKYDPIPDEPRYRKKAKKAHVRSDHKHVYETVAVDEEHAYVVDRTGRHKAYHMAERCRICGRIGDAKFHTFLGEPPKGMRMFRVDSFLSLFEKTLPDELEVSDR